MHDSLAIAEAKAFRASSLGLWAFNTTSGTFHYSDRFLAILGHEPGHDGWDDPWPSLFDWVHEDDRAALTEQCRAASDGWWPVDIEVRIAFQDGSARWLHLRGRAEEVDGNTEIVGCSEDITQRVKTTLELEEERTRTQALLDETRNMQRKLVETSRVAGMAEIATGVLHDIGNVINSVSVAGDTARTAMKDMRIAPLTRVIALLDDAKHEGGVASFVQSDRGHAVLQYLRQACDDLQRRQADGESALDRLERNVTHARSVLSAQQQFAKNINVEEVVAASAFVDDLTQINRDMLTSGIALVGTHPPGLTLRTDRHKVLQILVNLVRNAVWATRAANNGQHTIDLHIEVDGFNVLFKVIDHGVGLPKEDLDRVFQHGFTKRKNGHGFGLHSGANVAKELGGCLHVHSDGPGSGATFTLSVPKESHHATTA